MVSGDSMVKLEDLDYKPKPIEENFRQKRYRRLHGHTYQAVEIQKKRFQIHRAYGRTEELLLKLEERPHNSWIYS